MIDTKDAYYFPHDSNAHNDEKCLYIIKKYGMQGYGLYWCFIESMHEQADGKLTVDLLEGFSLKYNTDITLLKQFYDDAIKIQLFNSDGKKYWSNRVLRNKKEFEKKKKAKSQAGKKGMATRWRKDNSVITELYQSDNSDITKNNKGKESKGKESKVNNTLPKGSMSEASSDPHQEIIDFYNLHRNKMPEAKTMSKGRKGLINARLEKYGIDTVKEVIEKAEQSEFLNGGGNKGWVASGIDWILRPENFPKILEGKYDNREQPQKKTRQQLDEEQRIRVAKMMEEEGITFDE